MPWYCTKHEMHSIDDVCPECERTSPEKRIAELELVVKAAQAFVDWADTVYSWENKPYKALVARLKDVKNE